MNVRRIEQRPLFLHPPTQCFEYPEIPLVETRTQLQGSKFETSETLWNSIRKQSPPQRSNQNVHMDPRYQKPQHYSQIQKHRQLPPVEVNEMGPTIQQGVIQHPARQGTLPRSTDTANVAQSLRITQTAAPASSRNHINGNTMSDPEGTGRDRLPDCDHNNNDNGGNNGYVIKCIHENRPFPLNDVARPVFVNHYYAGELLVPVTNKKLIHLDECDTSMENSMRNPKSQGSNRESVQTLWELLRIPISTNKDFRVTGPPDNSL